jgi:hypothetical protein
VAGVDHNRIIRAREDVGRLLQPRVASQMRDSHGSGWFGVLQSRARKEGRPAPMSSADPRFLLGCFLHEPEFAREPQTARNAASQLSAIFRAQAHHTTRPGDDHRAEQAVMALRLAYETPQPRPSTIPTALSATPAPPKRPAPQGSPVTRTLSPAQPRQTTPRTHTSGLIWLFLAVLAAVVAGVIAIGSGGSGKRATGSSRFGWGADPGAVRCYGTDVGLGAEGATTQYFLNEVPAPDPVTGGANLEVAFHKAPRLRFLDDHTGVHLIALEAPGVAQWCRYLGFDRAYPVTLPVLARRRIRFHNLEDHDCRYDLVVNANTGRLLAFRRARQCYGTPSRSVMAQRPEMLPMSRAATP